MSKTKSARRSTLPSINGYDMHESDYSVRMVAQIASLADAYRLAAKLLDRGFEVYVERFGCSGQPAIVFEESDKGPLIESFLNEFRNIAL